MRRRTALQLAVLLLTGHAAAAQSYAMDRGVWQLDGSASLTSQSGCCGNPRITTLSINPQVGYFVAPGLAVTGNLLLDRSSSKGFPTTTGVGAGPGLAYYFIKGPTAVHPYLAGAVLYQHFSTAQSGGTQNSFSWMGSGGIAALLARNVALTGELYYRHSHSTFKSNAGSASANASIYGSRFGFAVFLY